MEKLGKQGVPEVDGVQCLEYELVIDKDTQCGRTTSQWYFFRVNIANYSGLVRFRIANMAKKRSLYKDGQQPYVWSRKQAEEGWQCNVCDGISYSENTGTGKGSYAGLSTLGFTLLVEAQDEVFIAAYPPYTYTMMKYFIAQLDPPCYYYY